MAEEEDLPVVAPQEPACTRGGKRREGRQEQDIVLKNEYAARAALEGVACCRLVRLEAAPLAVFDVRVAHLQ